MARLDAAKTFPGDTARWLIDDRFPVREHETIQLSAGGRFILPKPIVSALARHHIGERDDGLVVIRAQPIGRGFRLCKRCICCDHERPLLRQLRGVHRANQAFRPLCLNARRYPPNKGYGFGEVFCKWS